MDDGGSREYNGLFYKIIAWNRVMPDGAYKATRIYFPPQNKMSADELFSLESENIEQSFLARVEWYSEDTVTVLPLEGEREKLSADKFLLSREKLADIGAISGSAVRVFYKGGIRETYPASVTATRWELTDTEWREKNYEGAWLSREAAELYETPAFSRVRILEIYKDCFFAASTASPSPYMIKVNAELSDEWHTGDTVTLEYEAFFYDENTRRAETDVISVKAE